jgi:sirohydrochlorin cobaltochelatase
MSEKTAIMVCGHGSRDAAAIQEFESVWQGIHARLPDYDIESGFLEFATPVINDGLDKLRRRGATHVLAVPGMLFAAGHAKNDIPSVLATYEARHPELRITYARELGVDPKLIRASGARIEEVIHHLSRAQRQETLLLFVGRGASDPDANANVAKCMRLVWEGTGFGWGEVAYSGVTFPGVKVAMERAARLGFKRIVVFPYFLFTGVLVRRIYAHADLVAAEHPEIEVIKAPYLADHPLVLDAFAERVQETLTGDNAMNCKLCKYRDQVLGFEDEVGLPQESHHHHVEGIGTGGGDGHHHHHHGHGHDHHHAHAGAHGAAAQAHAHSHPHGHDHGHGHGHSHSHGHAHHHHPYPQRDHPLGPQAVKGLQVDTTTATFSERTGPASGGGPER